MDQHLRQRVRELEQQLESTTNLLSERNIIIAQLNSDIDRLCESLVEAEDEVERLRRTDRILHSTDGRTAIFRRNHDGVYVEVQDQPEEEPIRNVRRRLNFDSDSTESELEDEFMQELMFGEI